jgi:hypothetical protein
MTLYLDDTCGHLEWHSCLTSTESAQHSTLHHVTTDCTARRLMFGCSAAAPYAYAHRKMRRCLAAIWEAAALPDILINCAHSGCV